MGINTKRFHFRLLFLISVVCNLIVDASVKHTAPRLRVEPADTYVVEGKPTRLSCRATGQPAPRFVYDY